MNDRDEDIDRTEQISYRKIVYQQTLQTVTIAYYKTSVHVCSIIILHALQYNVHSVQWAGHVYVTNIIFILSKT